MWFLMNDCLNKKSEKCNKIEDLEDLFSWKNLRLVSSQDEGSEEYDKGTTATLEKPKLKKPPLYKVILINDDYTPMEFVVEILCSFFGMNAEKATQIMLKVHTEGKGVCGVFSKDVAESKAAQVNDYSRECEQPLLCSVEVDR